MSTYGPNPASGIPGLGQAQRVGRSDPDKRRRQREDKEEKKDGQKPAPADSVELHDAAPAPDGAPAPAAHVDQGDGAEPPPHIDIEG